jgi:hypothetical protein
VNIGDRTIADDENVSSLVKQFCDKKITFCSGFDDETKVEKAPIEQIFVELVNGKIMSRGRTCKFKVDLPNSKVIFQYVVQHQEMYLDVNNKRINIAYKMLNA